MRGNPRGALTALTLALAPGGAAAPLAAASTGLAAPGRW